MTALLWSSRSDLCGALEGSMGFFDFLKPRSKTFVEECWPGGKMLQVHMEYDTQKAVFTYMGRYGLQFSVPKVKLTNVIVKEVSRTHSVLQMYSGSDYVGTTDVIPTESCNIMKDWVLQY